MALAAIFAVLLPASPEAKYVCGNFEGKFSCRYEPSTPKVKGAVPTAKPRQDAAPDSAGTAGRDGARDLGK
ncbi:MAG: hypothetical protein R6X03_07775 [Methyloceanibacter sp.]